MAQPLATVAQAAAWVGPRLRGALRTDHRQVRPGDVFLAWPGARHDARAQVARALQAGAAACLVEAEGAPGHTGLDDARVAALPALERLAGELADACLGQPTARLDVVAVTGTNGKTSTAWWVAQALAALGRRCGLVGTLGVGEPPALAAGGLTTPDAVALQSAFADFARQGLDACAIEASSIGLDKHRLAGTRVAVAAFTNLTQDHLDYHGTMQAYWAAKRRLFDFPGLRAAVVNVDDAHGAGLAAELAAGGTGAGAAQIDAGSMPSATGSVALWTVSRAQPGAGRARLQAHAVAAVSDGLAFDLVEDGSAHRVRTALVGDFNVDNLLVVAGCLRALGLPLARVAAALGALGPVPGRLQRVRLDGASQPLPELVVDYAHTPDALDKALAALAPWAAARGGVLWCVFGCGGDRDPGKRPLMGAAAARGARHVIVTSDNPRSEPPALIVQQVLAGTVGGAAEVMTLEDRREAINHAVRAAAPADLVLVAGKGHEQTQEVAGTRHPFSDVDEALRALRQRAGAASPLSPSPSPARREGSPVRDRRASGPAREGGA
jgi:UDP-N-acetylmuramoyl-L-alanyl-D-glutamate--2,6-diaminopimelate ligase